MIKKIGVLTSGGDSPGMNMAVATIIKYAKSKNLEVVYIRDGFLGLYNNWIEKAEISFADNILQRGGTAIGSARFPEFANVKTRVQALNVLKQNNIEALVVIGGDGSYQGALKLTQMGINCVGIPGTIDNDISSSDYTIGFDTCLNTIVENIDKVRDTMTSHNRCGIIEVMGKLCGDLALYSGSATLSDVVVISEKKLPEAEIVAKVKEYRSNNKRSVIVLVSELMYDIESLAKKIESGSGYVTKATKFAHIQRGGKPSAFDRWLAYSLSIKAIDELLAGNGGICVGITNNQIKSYDIIKASKFKRPSRMKELLILNNF